MRRIIDGLFFKWGSVEHTIQKDFGILQIRGGIKKF